MPLYELVLLTRCSSTKGTAQLLRQVSETLIDKGANVREMRILGDRILQKQLKGNDQQFHIVGRYLSVLFDGNPQMQSVATDAARSSFETIRTNMFRVKDFFSEAQQFKKEIETIPTIIDSSTRQEQYVEELKKMSRRH